MKLKGYVLVYTDGGNPSFREFSTREALEQWVGRWHLKVGRSDSDWIDAVVNGEVEILDESLKVYHEDADTRAEPQDADEPGAAAPGNEELDDPAAMAVGSVDPFIVS